MAIWYEVSHRSIYQNGLCSYSYSNISRCQGYFSETHNLLREKDEVVYGDSGYIGIEKREEIKNDENLCTIDFHITRRSKSLPKVFDDSID